MKKIVSVFVFLLLVNLYPLQASSYPLTEKISDTQPLPLDVLTALPTTALIPQSGAYTDRYLLTVYGNSLTLFDLQTWNEYVTQPDAFDADIAAFDLLANETSVIIALTDGNLARLELDDEDTFVNTNADIEDEEDSRQITVSDNMTSAGASDIVADPDDSGTVYVINSSGYYYIIDIDDEEVTEVELTNSAAEESSSDDDDDEDDSSSDDDTTSTTTLYTPADIAFATSSNGDKVLVTTDEGTLLVFSSSATSFNAYSVDSSAEDETPSFSRVAVTSGQDYVYLIDDANDVLWVFSIPDDDFVDQQEGGTDLDPIVIDADENDAFTDILMYTDAAGSSVAYVAGTAGLSVLDVGDPDSDFSVIDADPTSGGDEDPVTTTETAGLVVATTSTADYILSLNTDGTISVISDAPWVTITAITPEEVTADASTFTVTFQSDTIGTYTVKTGSRLTGTEGTELLAATAIAAVDTDTTTAEIDINNFARSTFVEGYNNIEVFVTDANSLVGHNAALLHVDRPPEPITISSTNFGNKKVYVNFTPSPDADISHYYVYAEPAENQVTPTCPGTLTFDSTNTVTNTFYATECSDSICAATVTRLTNDIAYCVAVKVFDEGGQESAVATYAEAVTPLQTAGPAGYFGETSCALNTAVHTQRPTGTLLLLAIGLISLIRLIRPIKSLPLTFVLLACLLPLATHADETTPQHWTVEVRGAMWIPTETGMKDFVGSCCHFGGEVEFGWLYKNQLNVVLGSGLSYLSGDAVAINNGATSADAYHLYLIPLRLDAVYRLDLKSDQIILPYARAGLDAVVFYETTAGDTINNIKYGVHGGVGVGLLLDRIESLSSDMENDIGVNDVYLTFEGRYAFLNNFGGNGMDLSGFYPYVGLLFEF